MLGVLGVPAGPGERRKVAAGAAVGRVAAIESGCANDAKRSEPLLLTGARAGAQWRPGRRAFTGSGSLLYKVVDSRGPKRSTALVTNIGFEAWADYLGDAPPAMAILDRLVDGAIVLKIEGRSYRAHRSKQSATPPSAEALKAKQRRRSTG